MTKQEFNSKYHVEADSDDVLTIIAANLSDVQHMLEFDQNLEANKRLNSIKEFIFDFRKLNRLERLAEMRGQLETV